jgi:hypothetical protein
VIPQEIMLQYFLCARSLGRIIGEQLLDEIPGHRVCEEGQVRPGLRPAHAPETIRKAAREQIEKGHTKSIHIAWHRHHILAWPEKLRSQVLTAPKLCTSGNTMRPGVRPRKPEVEKLDASATTALTLCGDVDKVFWFDVHVTHPTLVNLTNSGDHFPKHSSHMWQIGVLGKALTAHGFVVAAGPRLQFLHERFDEVKTVAKLHDHVALLVVREGIYDADDVRATLEAAHDVQLLLKRAIVEAAVGAHHLHGAAHARPRLHGQTHTAATTATQLSLRLELVLSIELRHGVPCLRKGHIDDAALWKYPQGLLDISWSAATWLERVNSVSGICFRPYS